MDIHHEDFEKILDISMADGEVVIFVLKDLYDNGGINNIVNWFKNKLE